MTPVFHRWLPVAGLATLVLLSSSVAPASAQPDGSNEFFYLERLREGQGAFARGEHREAARFFRLACFGFLDQPTLLTECVARLSLAELAGGDRRAARDSLQRLVSLVDRFDRYADARLDQEMRTEVEDAVLELLAAESIGASPTFSRAAQRRRQESAEATRGMTERQRALYLRAQIEAEPQEPSWLVALAELRLADGRSEEAESLAGRALELDPQHVEARCLRGASRAAESRQCREVLLDMAACPRTQSDPQFTRSYLSCQLELGELSQALQFIGSLPAETLSDAGVQQLARTARERADRSGVSSRQSTPSNGDNPGKPSTDERSDSVRSESAQSERDSEREGAGKPQVVATSVPSKPTVVGPGQQRQPRLDSRLTSLERAALDRAQSLLRQAATVQDLEEALAFAQGVADAHPDDSQAQYLVATIAYRASHFVTAVLYFERGGDPGIARADLLFYQAVSLYESGYESAAAATLRRCLSSLERNDVVERYARAILEEG